MPPSLSGLIFDFDGTLADTFPGINGAWQRTFSELGLGTIDPALIRRAIGPTKDIYLRMILGERPDDLKERALRRFKEIYRGEAREHTLLFPGIPELLDRLAEKGIPIAIASNKPAIQVRELVEHFGFARRFDPILAPEMVKEGKPSPDMLLECARQWRLPAGRLCVIGDTPLDLQAGKAAGMKRAAVLWGYTSEEELLRFGPDSVFTEPGEVAGLV